MKYVDLLLYQGGGKVLKRPLNAGRSKRWEKDTELICRATGSCVLHLWTKGVLASDQSTSLSLM